MIEFHAGYFLFIYRFDCFDSVKRKKQTNKMYLFDAWIRLTYFFPENGIFPVFGQRKSVIRQSLFQVNEAETRTFSEIYFTMQLRATIQTEAWVAVFFLLLFIFRPLYKHTFYRLPCVFCVKFSNCVYVIVVGSFYTNIIHVCCEMVSLLWWQQLLQNSWFTE